MRQSPQWQWHLDEVSVKLREQTHYLRRAVNHQRNIKGRARFKSLRDAALLEWQRVDLCVRPARSRKLETGSNSSDSTGWCGQHSLKYDFRPYLAADQAVGDGLPDSRQGFNSKQLVDAGVELEPF